MSFLPVSLSYFGVMRMRILFELRRVSFWFEEVYVEFYLFPFLKPKSEGGGFFF